MKKLIVLLDYSLLAFRAIFVVEKYISIKYNNPADLGIFVENNIYSQWVNIKKEVYEYSDLREIDRENVVFIFCEDRGAGERKGLDLRYKENREKNKSIFENHLQSINKAKARIELDSAHFVFDPNEKLEADDIIYTYTKMAERRNKAFENNIDEKGLWESLIVSSDSDLATFIRLDSPTNKTSMLRLKSNGLPNIWIRTIDDFEKEFKIPYNTNLLYKTLCGDRSDSVKGVKSFGKKTFHLLIDYIKYQLGEVEAEELFATLTGSTKVLHFIDNHLVPFIITVRPRGFAKKKTAEIVEVIHEARKSLAVLKPIKSMSVEFPVKTCLHEEYEQLFGKEV